MFPEEWASERWSKNHVLGETKLISFVQIYLLWYINWHAHHIMATWHDTKSQQICQFISGIWDALTTPHRQKKLFLTTYCNLIAHFITIETDYHSRFNHHIRNYIRCILKCNSMLRCTHTQQHMQHIIAGAKRFNCLKAKLDRTAISHCGKVAGNETTEVML